MAITGTKIASSGSSRNYFVNECTITGVEVMDSQYTDMSLKVVLEDNNNGYSYNCFVNQNFEKDTNGVVTGLKFPEDLNTLYLATGADLNVTDAGVLEIESLESLTGKEVACISYQSSGKYKRNTWGVVSSIEDKENLESKFQKQLEKGYPKDYQSPSDNNDSKPLTKTEEMVMDTLINKPKGEKPQGEMPF
jgi:hypothetical protein